MLSAFIPSRLSYPAVLLAEQLVHQRSVHPGPLVLRTAPLKFPTPATDRDRTVSRRSEPSSRAALRRADIEVPNLPVDVDSWGRSACYPRGSFYPLSDGPPTRYHRITKPDFRPCSTCGCRSQAPFCLCTLRTISDRSEGTFGRLRYIFGGDRPSQTAHLTMSCHQIHGIQLEPQYYQGGIPRVTPPKLTLWFPSLPPILYRQYRNSMLSYSKALRGLSVPQIITPFVRVRTYLTRNFATLGPL